MINRTISFFVALIVFSGLIYWFLKNKANNSKSSDRGKSTSDRDDSVTNSTGLNIELVKNKWLEIESMQNNGASGLKNALIEADKLLDYVMIQKGFAGETMGDRLKSGGNKFNNLNAIWAAHKLRNQIAHEVEHDVVADQVKNAITVLGNGIQQLGVAIK